MEKELLNQYKCLRREYELEKKRIRAMEKKIEEMTPECAAAADVVSRGKKGQKTLGLQKIQGYEDYTRQNRSRARLRERKARQELRLAEIENMIIDVEDFINYVPDSEMRTLLRLFYIDGKSWREAAVAMGEGYSEDACKKKAQRFFDKK